jgi:hypothetical protein
MSAHALASPSSAEMWMHCPASITKSEGRVRPSSIYAKEGTAAHKIAELLIGGDMFPPTNITVEGTQFVVGKQMLDYLNDYVDFVQGLEKTGDVWIETRVGLTYTNGMVWGTADCIGHDKKQSILTIADLKYGKGVPVAPDTAQLKIYALGAMDHLQIFPDWVNLMVFQPRLDPQPKTHVMDFGEMMEWGANNLRPAVQRLEDGDLTENAGSWCRWCVRRNECAAFASKKSASASEIFNDGVDSITPYSLNDPLPY